MSEGVAARGTPPFLDLDKVTAVLCCLVLVDTFGYAVVLPLLPFAAEHFGASSYAIGAMFASYSLFQLVAAPVLGALGDRFGRRPVLLLSQSGSAAGFALLIGPSGFWALLLSRTVDGLTAGNVSLVYAAVLDHFSRETWGGRFAYLSSAAGAGIVLGLLTSSFIARFGLAAAASLALLLTGLTLVVTWRLLPETRQRQPTASVRNAWRLALASGQRAILGRIGLGVLMSTIAQTAFLLALPIYLARLLGYDVEQATRFIALLFVAAAVFQVAVVPRVIDRCAARGAALIGFALLGAGGLIVAIASILSLVVAGATLLVCGISILSPSLPALLGERNTTLDEGVLMGLNQSVVSVGQMLGPLLGYSALVLSTTAYGAVAIVLAGAGFGALQTVGKETHDGLRA